MKQGEVSAQNRELKSFQDRLGLKLGEVSAEVRTAEKNIEELGDLKTKLETANRTLSEKDTSLSQMVSQSQMSVMGMNGLSAGQVLGRPNINGLQGGVTGGSSVRPISTQRNGLSSGFATTGRSSLAAQGGLSATKYDK